MNELTITDLPALLQEAARQTWPVHEDHAERSSSYRLALGREIIQLGVVEFRILLFLASKPYHAFTRRSIAEARTVWHRTRWTLRCVGRRNRSLE